MAFGPGWIAPFVGLLLSLAILPVARPVFWHRHYGKVSAFWALAFALPFGACYGVRPALDAVLHTLLRDYLPFAILLGALFTVAGGIRLTGTIRGTPGVNTLMLLIGTAAASVMGTTGAAMLVVRPLIRANRLRRHSTHVFVFFIFLVANIGGALTPLGDPPLLIGFLQGVPFFWPTRHLFLPMTVSVVLLLAVFYALDRHFHRRGWTEDPDPLAEIERLGVDGKVNLPLLALIPLIVLLSGEARSRALPEWLIEIAPNLALVVIAALSLRLTRPGVRRANAFGWGPIVEVALVFAAIFVTVIPALAILRAGQAGALAPLAALVSRPGPGVATIYFWLTGGLSSLLDNAPTYLVFYNLAGGDPAALTGADAGVLTAISAGAVFMGANTYIGNAPNFMVRSICEERGIRMPSFFGYTGWACVVLLPLYGLLNLLFFR